MAAGFWSHLCSNNNQHLIKKGEGIEFQEWNDGIIENLTEYITKDNYYYKETDPKVLHAYKMTNVPACNRCRRGILFW